MIEIEDLKKRKPLIVVLDVLIVVLFLVSCVLVNSVWLWIVRGF